MSKTNDTSKLLTDSELDAVSGGVIKIMGNVKWDAVELRRGTSGNSSFGTER